MWKLNKEDCTSDSSAKPEEIIPPICTEWWHRPAIAWMEWDVPVWFDRLMTIALGRTWRGCFPNFILHHFIYTGEWQVSFTWWGSVHPPIYKQRFLRARTSGIPEEYLPSKDSFCPKRDDK